MVVILSHRKNLHCFTWGAMLLLLVACSVRQNPQINLGAYYFVGKSDESLASSENDKILEMSRALLLAILHKKTEIIVSMIDPDYGAIIDAKNVVPYAKVKTALLDESHPLHKTLWNEKAMQATDSTGEIHSYQKYFQSTDKIEIMIFYYSSVELEVRLNFKNRPSIGVMGNLIFQKRRGQWYLLNFF